MKKIKKNKTKVNSHALRISRPRIGGFFSRLKERFSYQKTTGFVKRRPFISFFVVLLLLLGLILLGSTVFKPQPLEEKPQAQVKQVSTFKIGSSPKVSAQAQVEKSGVIKIVAQMPGIVSSINFLEGDEVAKGKALLNLSSNYQGGNAMSLSRQIAGTQLDLARQTFDTQVDLIKKQREVAERTDANNELRDIGNRSLDETRSLLDLNESLLSTLQSQATGSADLSDPAAFQAASQRAQLQAAVNQLRQAARTTEFQSASDRPPAQLSDLQREITLKNLEVQEKSLEANKQITSLQYQLALVNEAQMYPASPFAGVVERVHVKVGQAVNPGTVLVTFTQNEDDITLNAKVPENIAKNVSQFENSIIHVRGRSLELMPYYVSSEATEVQLYSVLYVLEDSYKELFTDGGYVSVEIPVGAPDTNSVVPFIPIDSVFQTQEESIVFVLQDGKAQSKKVTLGDVQGRFVAVQEGIGANDELILSRNVVEGDQVNVKR
jgi:multidrug efflux pump subunit AcrA (membrane-fusion protein)